jgi:hypothetical protein
LGTSGNPLWTIAGGTGHLLVGSDNTNDIGASGATRPRTIYAATSIVLGVGQTWAPIAQAGAEGSKFSFSGTLTSSPADFNCWTHTPVLAGAFTVTRLNYLDLNQVTGAATVTDAAVFRFDAAIGTHKALASPGAVAVTLGTGPTGANAGNPLGWMKINVNGAIKVMPFW